MRMSKSITLTPNHKICLIYLAVSTAWILITDYLARYDSDWLHMAKGIFFVVCTTVLLYVLLQRYMRLVGVRTRQLDLASSEGVVGIVRIGESGTILESNDAFLHMCGGTRAEMDAGLINWHNLTSTEYGEVCDLSLRQAQRAGICPAFRMELQQQSGVRTPVLVRLASLESTSGETTAFVQDLSTLEQVGREARRLSRIVETTEQPIISFSLAGDIRTWNHGAEQVYGYSAEETVGQNGRMLIPANENAQWEKIQLALSAEQSSKMECRLCCRSGEIKTVLLEICPDLDDKGQIAGAITFPVDLVDVKRAQLMEEQFQQAQKLESLGRLAGGVAHDFNNLLMVIISYVQLLSEDSSTSEQQRHMLDEIMTAADRATSLTRQLLAFSRKQPMKMEVLDLNATLAETSRMLERVIGEDIKLQLQPTHGLWHIEADASGLSQVLMNLCVNARDAMPKGGELTITTYNHHQEAGNDDAALPEGDYICLTVKDTGTGMNEVTRAHLFEPFFTTKEQGRGTGLGLSMVYGVVNQCGGQITVESQLGHGSIFRIYLPRTLKDSQETQVAQPKMTLTGIETLLVVEDEYSLRSSIAQYMKRKGYQVLTAPNGIEAIQLLLSQPMRPDLLLTDMGMPRMNGRQLWEHLQKEFGHLPAIFMTGYSDPGDRMGDLAGSVDFLSKPFALEELARCVRNALDQNKPEHGTSPAPTAQ